MNKPEQGRQNKSDSEPTAEKTILQESDLGQKVRAVVLPSNKTDVTEGATPIHKKRRVVRRKKAVTGSSLLQNNRQNIKSDVQAGNGKPLQKTNSSQNPEHGEGRFVRKKNKVVPPVGRRSAGNERRLLLPPGMNAPQSEGLKRPAHSSQFKPTFRDARRVESSTVSPEPPKPQDPNRFAKYSRKLSMGAAAAVGMSQFGKFAIDDSPPPVEHPVSQSPVPEVDIEDNLTVHTEEPQYQPADLNEQSNLGPSVTDESYSAEDFYPEGSYEETYVPEIYAEGTMEDGEPFVPYYDAEAEAEKLRKAEEESEKQEWGYSFILTILFTIIGSVTIAVYVVLLNSNFSMANIMVNVSIISLLIFLFAVIGRYLALLFLSFLHHAKMSTFDDTDEFLHYKVSVLVPAYNEGAVITQSIESLLDMDYHNYEIIVVDDGSSDNTYEIAKTMEGTHGNVEVVVLTQINSGKSNALNHAASVATGDIIVCMDADSKLAPNTLKAGVRYFEDPKMGAVAGNVKVVNRDTMITNLQALEYIEGLNLVRRAQAFFKAVNIVPGPIGFFRRSIIKDLGGWEDDTYAEDCDLTLKVLSNKWRIDYEPAAISYTEAPEKLMELLKQRYRWTRGILQSIRKNRYNLIDLRVGWRVTITMWQMIFEAILWPMANILAQVMMVFVALLYGMSPLIVLWWVQLTALDILAAMLTVAVERERLYLIFYAIIYRLVFVQIVDMAKLIATVEELMGTRMQWGKVERLGKLFDVRTSWTKMDNKLRTASV